MADTVALVVAAGSGARAGGGVPKQYRQLGGQPLLRRAAHAMLAHPRVKALHIVVAPDDERRARDLLGDVPATIGTGGATRQQSVHLGLQQIEAAHRPAFVLVHDAARPLVPVAMIERVLAALDSQVGACPALPVVDSLRRGDTHITAEVARDHLWRVQTPQGFRFAELLAAHEVIAAGAYGGATDDAEVLRAAGHGVALVAGDERAMKITTAADFTTAERWLDRVTLTGQGYDVHRFGAGDHLWLCGVRIPHHHGLIGHSDADVGLHALTDAVLGALGAGDIGQHFPPGDPAWKGASSDRFLAHAANLVERAGGQILHCDVTLICETPKIGPHRAAMLERLAEILHAHAPRLSVKATTTEGLGFTGRQEGIAAQAVATIRIPL